MPCCRWLPKPIKCWFTAERAQGEAEAFNIERTAENILQVLPAKVITSLPNTNIADAVGRLPSVTLERDEGEGKYVQIRGTEPRLSSVTVNGSTCLLPRRPSATSSSTCYRPVLSTGLK
jgi:outer membrane receptor for ferrienterochelin and colicin